MNSVNGIILSFLRLIIYGLFADSVHASLNERFLGGGGYGDVQGVDKQNYDHSNRNDDETLLFLVEIFKTISHKSY